MTYDDYEEEDYEEEGCENESNQESNFNGGSSFNNKQNNPIHNKINKTAKNTIKKATKEIIKKAGQILVKGIIKLLSTIIIPILPYILILFGFLILLYFSWDILLNSRGKTQDYQTEDPEEFNKVEKNDETGDIEATELSLGNKMVKAFYTYFAEQSIWVTVTDKNGTVTQKEPIQYNSPEFIKKFGTEENRDLKDKYGREKMFYLSPNALWTLDEFLNKNQFRFPEQFVQPVYHNKDTYELKDLVDENGKILAESKEYNPTTLEATGKKVNGIWDYGFGSILNYKQYEESREGRGSFKTTQIWDVEKEELISGIDLEDAKKMCEENPERYQGYNEKYYKDKEVVKKFPSNTSYLIDRVTSPAGFINNKVKQEWVDTGKKFTESKTYTKKVDVIREKVVPKMKEDPNDEGKKKPLFVDKDGNETFESKDENNNPNTPLTEKEKYKEKINKEFTVTAEGTIFEYIPQYEGEPDIGQITGNKYFKDYMSNYKSYVPDDVMGDLGIKNFKNRTGKDKDELLELLDKEPFSGGTSSGGSLNMDDFKLGSGASSGNFKKAMENWDYFSKYGNIYGVDPKLLVAIASQESGGNHQAQLGNCGSGGCGIMQIERPGIVIKEAKAYNQETKRIETMTITGISSVSNVADNIKAGAMLASDRMKRNKYNILIGLQEYNHGPGGTNSILKAYSKASGKSVEQIRNDVSDTGWLAHRDEVHRFPNQHGIVWNYSNTCRICEYGGTGHFGDNKYLEHVLRYYVATEGEEGIWVLKEDGSKVTLGVDGQFSIGSGTGNMTSNNDGWLSNIWKKLINKWNQLFPDKPKELSNKRIKFENALPEKQVDTTIKMMFVMEEQNYLTDYDDFDDDTWKAKFTLLFKNPIGSPWTGQGGIMDVKTWFPNGYTKPLKFNPLTIQGAYQVPNHTGIDIVAPIGSEVVAVADGEIVNVNNGGGGNKGKYIQIKHENGIYTTYGGLSEIYVKKGDKVTSGQVIARTGNTHNKSNVLHFELMRGDKTEDPTWMINGNFNAGDYQLTGEDAEIIQKIIDLAYSKIGCAYTQNLGLRKGPNSFDCSGFTWYLYNQVTGVNIGENTWGQDSTLNAHRVNIKDLKPGDILMPNDLHHVVLYIGKQNGKDVAIHASTYNVGVIKSEYANITSIYPKIYRPMSYVRSIKGNK